MTRRLFCQLWAVLVSSGCRAGRAEDEAQARAEAENARQAIAKELEAGAPEKGIAEFFSRHGWQSSYDEYFQRFSSDVYRSPDGVFTVMADLYVNERKEFTRSEVKVHITYF